MSESEYRTDFMILDADHSVWKEQLHRRQRVGWQLVALFAQNAAQAENLDPLVKKGAEAVTLLFRCNASKW